MLYNGWIITREHHVSFNDFTLDQTSQWKLLKEYMIICDQIEDYICVANDDVTLSTSS